MKGRGWDAFRNSLGREQSRELRVAQIDADLDFVKLRLREEIITAAFGADAGQRVLLESDPQALRAIGVLPDARRLAESVRNGTPISMNLKPQHRAFFLDDLLEGDEQDELLI